MRGFRQRLERQPSGLRPARRSATLLWRETRRQLLITPLVLFAVLLVLCGFRSAILFSGNGITGLLAVAAPVILGALALTPIAISGPAAVDLAVGPMMNVINIGIVIGLSRFGHTGPVFVFAFAIGAGILLEVVQGTIISLLRLQTIIVTLGGYLILAGLNLVLLSEPGGQAPAWLSNWSGSGRLLSPTLFVVIGALALWAVLARSTFFRNLRLMGSDERAAYTGGIRLVATRIGAFAVGGVYVGLAAIMYTALIQSADPVAGTGFTLTAVTALVLGGASLSGGRASAAGAVLGALDLALISYVLQTFQFGLAASYAQQLATGVVLVVALLVGNLLVGVTRRPWSAT